MGNASSGRVWPGDSGPRSLPLKAGAAAIAAFAVAFAIGDATEAQSGPSPGLVAAINASATPLTVVGIAAVQAPPSLALKAKPVKPAKPAGTTRPAARHASSTATSAAARRKTNTKRAHKTTSTSTSQTTTSSAGTGTVSGGG